MLSDQAVRFAGFAFTSFQLLIAGALLLGAAALLLLLSGGKRVSVQRSAVTDELAIHLGRIGDALERLAEEVRAARVSKEMGPPGITVPPRPGEETHPISYSMFGR